MKKMLVLAAVCFGAMAIGQDVKPVVVAPGQPGAGAGWKLGETANKPSAVRTLLLHLGNDRQVLYGWVPMVYKILGLTDEQMKTLEALCKEAKEENAAMSKDMKPPAGGPAGRVAIQEYYQGQQKKQDELMEKYQARINDILTAEQRNVLSRIKAIADEKKEQDKKTNEEIKRLIEKNQETFESKLNAILTPEQKKKLEELSSTATPRGSGMTTEPVKVNVEK